MIADLCWFDQESKTNTMKSTAMLLTTQKTIENQQRFHFKRLEYSYPTVLVSRRRACPLSFFMSTRPMSRSQPMWEYGAYIGIAPVKRWPNMSTHHLKHYLMMWYDVLLSVWRLSSVNLTMCLDIGQGLWINFKSIPMIFSSISQVQNPSDGCSVLWKSSRNNLPSVYCI